MRYRLIATLAAAFIGILLASGLALAEDALDPTPMTWRGLQMGPEQIFEGDYSNDFDTSVFHADSTPTRETMWLSGWQDRPGDGGGIMRRYHIRFVGRRTAEAGKYGALGAYPHTVLISRLISARVLIGN
ncbi:hypothetical protein [Phenylobacterium sp.]|jgi:hypothetical protein|uniref:hypothetical protein n=1 Tax=Phenylobacterium sp. TaxID=1871053 RepID=UPI0011FD43F4|nr:hypothetical protein [Phenylobacterium sp.]THD51287.1 MAG: hypothetical protein E8A12_21350 [Phenylobacterium sp.]